MPEVTETAQRYASRSRAAESPVFRSVALDSDQLEWLSSRKIMRDFDARQSGVECIGECIGR